MMIKKGGEQKNRERERPRTGKKNWEKHTKKNKHRGEQIFCPCFFSKKQRRSCLTIVRHEHVKRGHSLAL